MKIPFLVLLASLSGAPALASACDKEAALKRMDEMDTPALETLRGNWLRVHWTSRWDSLSREQRLARLRDYTAADTCVAGRPRNRIDFLRSGQIVGAMRDGQVTLK